MIRRQSVEEQLMKVQRNPVGTFIVRSIKDGKRDVVISPYTDVSHPNSKTSPKNSEASAPKGVSGTYRTDHGAWYKGEVDDPTTSKDERYDEMPRGMQGTGEGSDVNIRFSVGALPIGGPGSQPDEVLCHQLVHALRMTQGKCNTIPTDDNIRLQVNEEEFLAVVTTNVYMSANNTAELRADPFRALTARLAYLRGSGYSSVWSTPKDVLGASRRSSAKVLRFLK